MMKKNWDERRLTCHICNMKKNMLTDIICLKLLIHICAMHSINFNFILLLLTQNAVPFHICYAILTKETYFFFIMCIAQPILILSFVTEWFLYIMSLDMPNCSNSSITTTVNIKNKNISLWEVFFLYIFVVFTIRCFHVAIVTVRWKSATFSETNF